MALLEELRPRSVVFEACSIAAMREAGLLDEIDTVAPEVWQQQLVVYVEPAGDGRAK